jgi:hypothetical protein
MRNVRKKRSPKEPKRDVCDEGRPLSADDLLRAKWQAKFKLGLVSDQKREDVQWKN